MASAEPPPNGGERPGQRRWGTGRVSILQGTLLVVGMRWTDRAIGLLSTIILARLLVPADFGLVAMATITIGLMSVFLEFGVHIALIQNANATREHYDAAFTLRVLQTSFLAVVLWFAAPFAADYFHDERVIPVLRWLSLGTLIGGFENVGVITFQKEMRFGLEFQLAFVRRISAFLVTVTVAWILRDYWALVIGTLVSKVLGVVITYLAHPMRPRFSTKKIGEIFSVSQWVLVQGIGSYLDGNLHRILVGRRASAATLGAYTLAGEISAMPSTELLAPLNRVLFPSFVEVKERPAELKRLFLLAQGLQTTMVVPAAFGLSLVAPEVVALALGERWQAAIPFLQWLVLGAALRAITTSPEYIMLTLNAVRRMAVVSWFRVLFFVMLAFLLLPHAGALELAMMRVSTSAAGLGLTLWFFLRTFPAVRAADILKTINRPIMAALAMSAVLLWAQGFWSGEMALVRLILDVLLGVLVYAAVLLLLWHLARRPAGAERYVLDQLLVFWHRRRAV